MLECAISRRSGYHFTWSILPGFIGFSDDVTGSGLASEGRAAKTGLSVY
jgi:hypothetical protein